MSVQEHADVASIDMASAETYLKLARDAHECGDGTKFIAARKLLMVSLGISDSPPVRPMMMRAAK